MTADGPNPSRSNRAIGGLRYTGAAIVGVIFVFVTIATVVIFRTNQTVANPSFHTTELSSTAIYTYVYDPVATLLIDKLDKEAEQDGDLQIGRFSRELIGAIRAAFPPEWLEEQANQTINAFVPYLAGKVPGFRIEIQVGKQLLEAREAIKHQLATERIGTAIYEDIVRDVVHAAVADNSIPFGIEAGEDEIVELVARSVPPNWIDTQIASLIDVLIPYVVGEADGFVWTVRPGERATDIEAEMVAFLDNQDLTTILLDFLVLPTLEEWAGDGIVLPFQIALTATEIGEAATGNLTQDWFTAQGRTLSRGVVPYVSGRQDAFVVDITIVDEFAPAIDELAELANDRLRETYSSARPCTQDELQTLDVASFVEDGIVCRMHGLAIDELMSVTGVGNFETTVRETVREALPETHSFTEGDLRRFMTPDQLNWVDKLRLWIDVGFTYTDNDLLRKTAELNDDVQTPRGNPGEERNTSGQAGNATVRGFLETRDRIAGGFIYTHLDFLEDFKNGGGDVENVLANRHRGATVLSLRWVGLVIMIMLLFAFGFFSGKHWQHRVAWPAALLTSVMFFTWIFAGPIWNVVLEDAFDDKLGEAVNNLGVTGLEASILEKGREVTLSVTDKFINGIASTALVLWLAGGGSLVLAATFRSWWPTTRELLPGLRRTPNDKTLK